MTDIGHIQLIQYESNTDLASRTTFTTLRKARTFMKADSFRRGLRPC